jgi:hypothetical protein
MVPLQTGDTVQLSTVDGAVRTDRLAATLRGRTWRGPCPAISMHKNLRRCHAKNAGILDDLV